MNGRGAAGSVPPANFFERASAVNNSLNKLLSAVLVPAVLAYASACDNVIEDIKKDIAAAIMERLQIDDAEMVEEDPPEANAKSKDYPQVSDVEAASELRLGQRFAFRMFTVSDLAQIKGAVLWVKGSHSYFKVDVDPEPAPRGGYYVDLTGTFEATAQEKKSAVDDPDAKGSNDSDLAGEAFQVQVAFSNGKSKVGNYQKIDLEVSKKPVVSCPAAAACGERNCGRDPVCGTSCGGCDDNESCNYAGECEAFDTGNCVLDGCPEGQTCNPASFECEGEPAMGCSALGCDEGEVCNERTDECEPEPKASGCVDTGCKAGQVCNEKTGDCEPETCLVTGCDKGETCDPGTGLCQAAGCVTLGCEEGDVCNEQTGLCETPVVMQACDPVATNPCTGGDVCGYVDAAAAFVCNAPAEVAAEGQDCDFTGDSCAQGLGCAPDDEYMGCSGSGCCASYCDATLKQDPCGSDYVCKASRLWPDSPEVGLCVPSAEPDTVECDPLDGADSCPEGTGCEFGQEHGRFECVSGNLVGKQGVMCQFVAGECGADLSCISDTDYQGCEGSGCCATRCSLLQDASCGEGYSCQPTALWSETYPDVGVCLPGGGTTTCNALTRAECAQGQNCAWVPNDFEFECMDVGEASTQGSACLSPDQCGLGHACVTDTDFPGCASSECCAQLCNPSIANPGCPASTTCTVPSSWQQIQPGVGICQPDSERQFALDCDPYSNMGCQQDEACFFNSSADGFQCGLPNPAHDFAGDVCDSYDDCANGFVCTADYPGCSGASCCAPYCSSTQTCGGDECPQRWLVPQLATTIGYCRPADQTGGSCSLDCGASGDYCDCSATVGQNTYSLTCDAGQCECRVNGSLVGDGSPTLNGYCNDPSAVAEYIATWCSDGFAGCAQ